MATPSPEQFRGLIPHLVCSNAVEAIEFYKRAFGAEEQMMLKEPSGERVMHACVTIGGHPVFLVDDFPEYCDGKSMNPIELGGTPVTLHRNVDDCDAAFKRAVDAGATPRMPPADMFWGDRYAMVVDPFGHCWSFAKHLKDLTPEEMQAAMKEAFSQAPTA